MKFKPTSKGGGILVELSQNEDQLPGESFGQAVNALTAFNLKTILVPMDFSDCSRKALQYAIPFAKQFGAGILLVHVIHYSSEIPEMAVADTQTIQAAENELEKLIQKINVDSIPFHAVLRVGNPAAQIVEAAEESAADLIILSTHGRSGLARVFLGSTAERIVRHAPCPVLVVREREHEFVKGTPASSTLTNLSLRQI